MAEWPPQIGGVDYRVSWDSLKMSGDDQAGDTVSLTFQVPYLRTFDFVNGLKGISGGGAYAGRLAYPDSPNLVYRAWEVERFEGCVPLQTESKVSHHELSFIRVTFAPPRYEDSQLLDPADPLTAYEEQFNANAQILRLDNTQIEYDDGAEFDGEMGKIEISGTLTLTFPRLTTVNKAVVLPRLGQLNEAEVFGFPPGTVMFAGIDSHQSTDDTGNRTKEVQLSFLVQAYDWNAFMRDNGVPMLVRYKQTTPFPPNPPSWWPIIEPWPPQDGGVTRPFRYADHRQIFQGALA